MMYVTSLIHSFSSDKVINRLARQVWVPCLIEPSLEQLCQRLSSGERGGESGWQMRELREVGETGSASCQVIS